MVKTPRAPFSVAEDDQLPVKRRRSGRIAPAAAVLKELSNVPGTLDKPKADGSPLHKPKSRLKRADAAPIKRKKMPRRSSRGVPPPRLLHSENGEWRMEAPRRRSSTRLQKQQQQASEEKPARLDKARGKDRSPGKRKSPKENKLVPKRTKVEKVESKEEAKVAKKETAVEKMRGEKSEDGEKAKAEPQDAPAPDKESPLSVAPTPAPR